MFIICRDRFEFVTAQPQGAAQPAAGGEPEFPSTGVLYDFEGTNFQAIQVDDTRWTAAGGNGGEDIVLVVGGTRGSLTSAGANIARACSWNDASYTDCEAYITIPDLGTTPDTVRLYARMSQLTITGAEDGYRAEFNINAGTVTLSRVDNGALTQLATGSHTYAVDDQVGIRVNGTTQKVFINGVEVLSAGDETYQSAGRLWLQLQGNSNPRTRVDNFGGGEMA